MLIDWFTIVAQVINFLVLVWLLKRFLYRPILNAIYAREQHIADELADADEKRNEAEQERGEFQQKNAEFAKQRATNMNKVAEEAKAERTRLLDVVRQESDDLRHQLAVAFQNEQLSLQDSLSQRAQEEVFAMVRKALKDLADTSLEARMSAIFVTKLDELNDDEKANLQLAFKASDQPLIVHTAFDLPEEQHVLIKTALKNLLGEAIGIEFVTEPKVISGIEIQASGQKIAWSMDDYLSTLTTRINLVLQAANKAQASTSEAFSDKSKASPEPKLLEDHSTKQGRHETHI